MRHLSLTILLAVALFGQSWQTASELPGVDLTGLSTTLKSAALKTLREQDCNCGCNLKIAECRVKDPNCSYSRGLAAAVAREFKEGKSTEQVYATLREMQKQGPVRPKLLEDPVTIPVAGAPSPRSGIRENHDRRVLRFSVPLLRPLRSEGPGRR